MADALLKRYAQEGVLRVLVQLDMTRPGGSGNDFHWSSSSGGGQPLKTGTMCRAAIMIERQRLITLIIPWTKKEHPDRELTCAGFQNEMWNWV